jgi:hypothetical protein
MSCSHEHGCTVLEGSVRDQAELHALFQRLADFGLTLVRAEEITDEPS